MLIIIWMCASCIHSCVYICKHSTNHSRTWEEFFVDALTHPCMYVRRSIGRCFQAYIRTCTYSYTFWSNCRLTLHTHTHTHTHTQIHTFWVSALQPASSSATATSIQQPLPDEGTLSVMVEPQQPLSAATSVQRDDTLEICAHTGFVEFVQHNISSNEGTLQQTTCEPQQTAVISAVESADGWDNAKRVGIGGSFSFRIRC
jgi:hypothetical protein